MIYSNQLQLLRRWGSYLTPNMNSARVVWSVSDIWQVMLAGPVTSLVQSLAINVKIWSTNYSVCHGVWLPCPSTDRLKEQVEFWEEVKNNLRALSLYYASVEEHQIKNVPWKAWLFKCLNILNMACNIIKIKTDFYATCSCSPIYIFVCTVLVSLPRRAKFLVNLMSPEHCSTHQHLYARRSTFSDGFHNVSFTMQSHDQNSTLSLNLILMSRKRETLAHFRVVA